MIRDPARQGEETARLFHRVAPRLFHDLEEAGLLPAETVGQARREWECFALYACVRGLVAGGGFNRETAAAIDALHEAALANWPGEAHDGETEAERRRLIAERYAEYGAIGQAGGKSGAATVTERLGAAAATHMTGGGATPELSEMVGSLHETIVEGVAEAIREAARGR